MKVAVIAEHDGKKLKPSTLNAVSAALAFHERCDLILLGNDLSAVVDDSQTVAGLAEIIALDHPRFDHLVAEDISDALVKHAADYDVVIAAANTFGKNFMPRFAAMMDVNGYADVIAIESSDIFVRPVYAGNILQKVKVLDPKKILTVRPTAFDAQPRVAPQNLVVHKIAADLGEAINQYESSEISESERPELTAAKIIVSGGRGLQSGEKFKLIEELADKLGAAVGASRAAVDAGFVPNDFQVGQTGKVVAPELYIAVGISGAIQHLAGMKDSKIIVAINKDPEAPIFSIADYGLVGDLFEIVPEMIRNLP